MASMMASTIAVTDTHSLLWYADPRAHKKLGRDALAHFQRVDRREAAVYVPALVLAEVGELAHLGRITVLIVDLTAIWPANGCP